MRIVYYFVTLIYFLYFIKVLVYFNRIHFVSYKKITKYIDICNTFLKY